jgi:hypothetical protein
MRIHPRDDAVVGLEQRGAKDVCLVVEVMRQDSPRAACLAGDGADGGPGEPVPRDDPPG